MRTLGNVGRAPSTLYRRSKAAVLLAALLTLGVVGWEHLVHAWLFGQAGTVAGHLQHWLRDSNLAFPLALAAVWTGLHLARHVGLPEGGRPQLLERAALLSLVFSFFMVPGVGLHHWLDRIAVGDAGAAGAWGVAHHAGPTPGSLEAAGDLRGLALHGVRDALVGQMVAFPLAMFGFALLGLGRAQRRRRRAAAAALSFWRAAPRPARLSAAAVAALSLLASWPVAGPVVSPALAAVTDPCSLGTTPTKTFNVSAINVKIPYNKFGDNDPLGFMYVLDQNIAAVRSEETAQTVSTGLREDPIQPLVIRGNLGDCVTINFTNRLTQGLDPSGATTAAPAASLHVHGVDYQITSAGSSVGNNPNSFVAPGATATYTLFLDPALGEGGKVFHAHGDSRQLVAHGLFGVLNAEPQGSTYLDPQTAQPLVDNAGNQRNNWEAIIQPASGPSFREFTIIYHEVGDETFQLNTASGGKLPLNDNFTTTYRPGGKALNYRSEPFFDRMQAMNNLLGSIDESQGYGSYTFGDPSTPIMRSYLGEPSKTRLVHAGSDQSHVHHQHGGADRWRRSPAGDPTNNISEGLNKYPPQSQVAASIRLDSQTISPGESYNLEHECGAGGCQQVAGDFLYHCHIAHHYLAGMFSFWRVFDTAHPGGNPNLQDDPPVGVIPGRAARSTAVTSDRLVNTTVPSENGDVMIVASGAGPGQVNLDDWVQRQIPPQGVRIDSQDATVWNWARTTTADGLPLYQGEPEDTNVWANFKSATPGQRPNILFNPDNGRYTWPLLQPHLGQRPPFSPNRHSGTPWLGDNAAGTRVDGLCPAGAGGASSANFRTYNVAAITLPIQETGKGATDPNGEIFVLSENRAATLAGTSPAIPLAIRSNSAPPPSLQPNPARPTIMGDCVALTLVSQLVDNAENGNHSKVNMHTHFVQFDPQASDGVITGRSFEQSVRPYPTENRTLSTATAPGATQITVSSTARLRQGVFIAVGQGENSIEMRQIVAPFDPGNPVLTLDQPLGNSHTVGESVGVEFVQYRWFSDIDSGTVFWHDHVDGIHSWGHGLFGAHIIEPYGSSYHHPQTGTEVRSGQIVDIYNTTAGSCVGVVNLNQCGSFREFMVWLHDNLRGTGCAVGQECGSINLRANPFSDRGGDTNPFVFSSVTFGDPFTPMPRAYVGDQFVIRTIGLVERVGGLRVTGHRFRPERFNANGVLNDAGTTGISERFDYVLDGGAGGPAKLPGDYLYYSTRNFQLENGAWGLLRVHNTLQGDLKVLPGNPTPASGPGFPQLTFTGGNPPPASSPGNPCPASAPLKSFAVTAFDATLPIGDSGGTIYALSSDEAAILAGTRPIVPLVIRANKGACVQIQFTNHSTKGGGAGRAGLSLGKLLFDPQGSYGVAVGFNPDSSVPRNGTTTYTFYADQELGTNIFLNLANVSTLLHGAYGGLVVEPQGSFVHDPATGGDLNSGLQAAVKYPTSSTTTAMFRDMAVFFHSTDAQLGRSIMPYNKQANPFASLNYQNAPLDKRLAVNANPSLVFNSSVQGDPPTTILQAYPGDPVRLRVAVPAAENVHIFSIEGHSWPIDPGIANSHLLSARTILSGESFDAFLQGGAGGPLQVAGDYLYLDHRFPFTRAGMWGIFRVFATQQPTLVPLAAIDPPPITSGAPSAPTNVTAVGGPRSVTVRWKAPSSSGASLILGYAILAYLNGTTLQRVVAFENSSTTEVVLGLANASNYAFKVVAVNAQGISPLSTISNLVTPLSPPGAPANVAVVPGTSSASVSWTAPADGGGSAITGYVVTAWTNNGLTFATQASFGATASSGTLTGLTPGTTYRFTVAAINAVGTGPAWPLSNTVTPT